MAEIEIRPRPYSSSSYRWTRQEGEWTVPGYKTEEGGRGGGRGRRVALGSLKFASIQVQVAVSYVVYHSRARGRVRGGLAGRLDTAMVWGQREKSSSGADRHRETGIERSTAKVASAVAVAAAKQALLSVQGSKYGLAKGTIRREKR